MRLEQWRKDAKRLARGWARENLTALTRGREVLGDRLAERRALSDAQHVIAVERGYRSWPEFVAAARGSVIEPPTSPATRQVVATEYEYRPGEPVFVEVVRRERTVSVSDRGAAAAKAGLPPGWCAVADSIKHDLVVNISRHGAVSLPIVAVCPDPDELIQRIAYASLSLYQDLLELEQ